MVMAVESGQKWPRMAEPNHGSSSKLLCATMATASEQKRCGNGRVRSAASTAVVGEANGGPSNGGSYA